MCTLLLFLLLLLLLLLSCMCHFTRFTIYFLFYPSCVSLVLVLLFIQFLLFVIRRGKTLFDVVLELIGTIASVNDHLYSKTFPSCFCLFWKSCFLYFATTSFILRILCYMSVHVANDLSFVRKLKPGEKVYWFSQMYSTLGGILRPCMLLIFLTPISYLSNSVKTHGLRSVVTCHNFQNVITSFVEVAL